MARAPHALVGTFLPGPEGYRLVQLLGSGGTAHVYLADRPRAPGKRQRAAVKVLREEHAPHPDLVARFEREALVASRVRHLNVLEVYAAARLPDGTPYFVMELLLGLDLADTLSLASSQTGAGSLAPRRALHIARGAAAGLEAAHAAGVIHRDIKPENLFLVHAPDGSEHVKVLDFGLAWVSGDAPDRAPSRRGAVGTPGYAAPEEALGAPASPAADIYALGVVLYEMLTGRLPFAGPARAVADSPSPNPARPPPLRDLAPAIARSPGLEAIVLRALAQDPAARFVSMAELRLALEATSVSV